MQEASSTDSRAIQPLPADSAAFHVLCPICGGSSLVDKYTVNKFTVTKCKSCSLMFVRERPSKDLLGSYYSGDVDYVYNDPVNIANLNYYFREAKKFIESRVQAGRILDIGCAAGTFLDVMGNWERHGIEFPSKAGICAREKYGENVYLGALDDYPKQGASFDCITLFDVFDHMPNPIDALRKCNGLLRPGGLLVVKVHDIGCLFAKLSGSRFYAIVPPAHLFYYDRRTLSNTLNKAGFDVIDVRHMAHILLLKTIPYRLARGNTGSVAHSVYKALAKSSLGDIPIKKNLHDLITIFAVKR
ncbi:MAG TPA: class I SAM-dependent methyltransferase [Steroidobacteraceae bacterium]|nr:class I SAM-dependent methyltransferase [Steroidobacteraceae bacterium]